jgi:2-dehydropantoate 2-reductase
MRLAVLGAGSVGCFVGGAWAAVGLDTVFVGRDSLREEVAQNGLRLSDQSGWKSSLAPGEVAFSTDPRSLKNADLVLITVKSHSTAEAARQVSRNARKGTAVLSFQNGVSNMETLRALLPGYELIQGMVPFNVAHLGSGRFHKGTSGELVAQDMAATRDLAARVGEGPARLTLADDMRSVAWGKLLINLNNAVNALSGRTLLEQLRQRDFRRVVAASMVEALEVLERAGIEPAKIGPIPPRLLPHAIAAPDFLFRNLLLRVQKIDSNARSSMADDLAAGRPTEIDYLNGEVVKLAGAIGMDAPVNATIVGLVKQAEAGIEHLWSPKALREYVLERHRGAPGFGY